MTSTSPPGWAIRVATEAANRSPCAKSKRGAVVFHEFHLTSWGHNHLPAGSCDGPESCRQLCGKRCVHAEQYALLNGMTRGASMLHVKVVDGVAVPGGPPSCLECAKLIIASGIEWMWLWEEGDGAKWVRYSALDFYRTTLQNLGMDS